MSASNIDSGGLAMDPVVRHLLDVSVQQGQMFQELAHGLHTVTQELLSLKQTLATAMVPLPDPASDAQCLLTKLIADNHVKAFLWIFERVAEKEGWQPRE